MPFLYVNLLTYCNLQTLSQEDFVTLPRDIQGDLVTAKLKTTPMSKKNKVTFKGHTDRITGTRTDNENHLFSYSDDKTIRMWNIEHVNR